MSKKNESLLAIIGAIVAIVSCCIAVSTFAFGDNIFNKWRNSAIVIDETHKSKTSTEQTVNINNCDGKGSSEQTVKRTFNIILDSEVRSQVDKDVLENKFDEKYGDYNQKEVNYTIVAPACTNMEFVLTWQETKFEGDVLQNGKSLGAYTVLVPDDEVEQASVDKGGCSCQPSGDVPPPSIKKDSWFKVVASHFPFGYRPFNLFKWMYDDSSLKNGVVGIIIFLVRLVLAGILFFLDLFLIIYLGIGAIINLYFGTLAMSIYLAVVGLILVVWVFNQS